MSDEDVLAFAGRDARAVMTLNRKHFVDLHRSRPDHADIIVCTFDLDFVSQAHRIHAAIASESELIRKLIRVNASDKGRLRRRPLSRSRSRSRRGRRARLRC